nr:hypothetical protein [Oscillospiraceae bacterium]
MKRKNFLAAIALIALFALMLTACGAKDEKNPAAATQDAAQPAASLGLSDFSLSSSTWSSPNGATVTLTAIPSNYADGQSAIFSVRLEGTDVENVPCQWDGKAYTASAELNAADGYCYYVILTDADGAQTEVTLNTPNSITNEALINMETALNSYCHLLVESSESADGKLTITAGTAQIQPPRITNDGQDIVCTEAALVLSFNGEEVARTALLLPEASQTGLYELNIAGSKFDIPAMEDDQQLSLRLDVTLSNGQTLTDSNGTWTCIGGELLSAVG